MKPLFILILTLFLIPACATTQPIVETLVPITVGYYAAREFPHQTESITKAINVLLEETDDWLLIQDFHRWTPYILDIVKLDPYIRMSFLTLLSAIEVDLSGLDQYKAKAALIRNFLHHFLIGMNQAAQ